jgi:predicted RNase H-like HicB family nuclease
MKFTITLARDEDGMGIVECPAIPGSVSGSETNDEERENIKGAIGLCWQVRAEKGMLYTMF